MVPGVANYYANLMFKVGTIVVCLSNKRRQAIKVEGNQLSPINRGGTSARAQASVLGLYDTHRLRALN